MTETDHDKPGKSSRRKFLKNIGAGVGAVSLSGIAGSGVVNPGTGTKSGEKITRLSPEGKLVEVDKDDIRPAGENVKEIKAEARKGLPGHKFAMVIDLAKCKNARK